MCIYILHLSDICTLKQCICTPIGDLSKIHKSEKYKEILVVRVSQYTFLSVVCLVQQADKMHHKFHLFLFLFHTTGNVPNDQEFYAIATTNYQ